MSSARNVNMKMHFYDEVERVKPKKLGYGANVSLFH